MLNKNVRHCQISVIFIWSPLFDHVRIPHFLLSAFLSVRVGQIDFVFISRTTIYCNNRQHTFRKNHSATFFVHRLESNEIFRYEEETGGDLINRQFVCLLLPPSRGF